MIIFVLILGLILRLISLNQSLWLDEATSALTVKMPLADFFGKFMPGDFHPPLYYLTLRAWAGIFGNSEIAFRSLSVIFGIATVYIVYLIGRELVNKETGIIASLLLATSGLHIYYSQEARMYAMSAFLVSLLVYWFIKKRWVLFAITLCLIGLTDYLPLLILPVFWIIPGSKKKLLMSHIVLVIFGLVWSPVFVRQLTSGISVTNLAPAWVNVLGKFSIKEILLIPVKFMIGRVGFDNKFVYAFVIGFIFLVFGFLLIRSVRKIRNLKLIWLWLIIPLCLALIISIKLPVLNYFRFLFVLPAFYLIIAFGVNTLKKRTRIFFLVLVVGINLITSFVYLTNQKFQREDWRGLASNIKNDNKAVVVFPTKSQQEALVYYGVGERIVDINNLQKGKEDVWLVRYVQEISDPKDLTKLSLENLRYRKISEDNFNGILVWKYSSRAKID